MRKQKNVAQPSIKERPVKEPPKAKSPFNYIQNLGDFAHPAKKKGKSR